MNCKCVSIILCFYNAENKLSETIKYLMKLNIDGIEGIELIFVDNNSNDSSCELIKKMFQGFSKFPYKIIFEPKPGLSNARLAGITNSKYDILLFCDDDNWLSEDYLLRGLNILQNDFKIAILGGKGIAKSSIELPVWFNDNQTYYAVGEQINGTDKESCLVLYGAGMFMRKQAFIDITSHGFKFFMLGRTGTKLSSGEDSELSIAFKIAGYKIWYDKTLEFVHYIEPHRLTLTYLKKIKKGVRSSFLNRFYLDFYNGYVPRITHWFWLKEFVYSFKDGCLNLFKQKREAVERSFNLCWYLLRERKKYNRNAQKIINVCKALGEINNQNK